MEEQDMKAAKEKAPTPIALDGGWGWIVVLGAFIAYFIADGWAYSFGAFYPQFLDSFEDGKGKTALIGALVYGVPLLVSPIVCAMTNIYGCRPVTVSAGLICCLSFAISSMANSVDFLCVTTGAIASIGLAMTYIPALVMVTFYFEKRRGLATGLAVTGSGVGAFVFPPLIEFLFSEYTWKGALLIIGGIFLHVTLVGILFRPPPMTTEIEDLQKDLQSKADPSAEMHLLHHGKLTENSPEQGSGDNAASPKITSNENIEIDILTDDGQEEVLMVSKPYQKPLEPVASDPNEIMVHTDVGYAKKFWNELKLIVSSMMDKSLAKCWPFLLFCGSSFILYLWVGMPYVYLVDWAMLKQVGEKESFFLLSITGIGRAVGQVVLGYIGDLKSVDVNLLYAVSICIASVGTLLLPLCYTYAQFAVYSVIFGFFVSVTYALQMMCVVEIVGLPRLTNAFGLLQLAQGIATVLGTPVAGWLYDFTGRYDYSFYVAGSLMLLSGVMLLPLTIVIKKKKAQEKLKEVNSIE